MRLARGAYRVPARIARDADGFWLAIVDDEMFAAHPDPALAHMVAAIWHSGERIPEETYRWMLAVKAHARLHDPSHPALHPRKAIDHRLLTPIMPRTDR